MSYFSISDVVDTQKGRGGIKRYHILAKSDTTATVSTNYFNRYTLRGAHLGDIITAICSDGTINLEITADPDATGFWITTPLVAGGGTDDQNASEVAMNPVLATGALAGAANVQDALTLLNDCCDAQNIANMIAADPVAVSIIWGAIVANHMSWDGTQLCIDYNNDGDPAA